MVMDRGMTQPKIPDNGSCLLCCGKAPGPIDVNAITRDGGKFIQHADGRIVEYFTYGSEDPLAPVFLQINGSLGTGYFPANLPLVSGKMKELGLRGLSITIPGHGYTSMFDEGYQLGSWARLDVEPVLAAEGMGTAPLMVEGSSYGAGIALGVAKHFGDRLTHMHLHVPYIPYELRKEVGIPDKIGDDAFFNKDMAWANSWSSCWFHCACQCCMRGCLLNLCGLGSLDDSETKAMEAAAPGSTVTLHRDISRAMRHGQNTFGMVHNAVGGLITKNWGFDVKDVKAPKTKVMISYNVGDTQCAPAETLPKNPHGEWLAEHFGRHAATCKVNVGGGEGKPNQHGAQMHKLVNGEFVAQLAAL